MSSENHDFASHPRIFCIGRNYAKHIAELGDADAEQCVIFMKPTSCLVPVGTAVHLPRDQGAVHHEAELVVQIGRAGSNIAEENACEHIQALTLGLDLTLRDLQNTLKAQSAPWERSKAFEHSAPLGEWRAYQPNMDLADLDFTCHINAELRQHGHTRDMLFPVPRLISLLSNTWALRPGDMIFTGTPEGVGPLNPGESVVLKSPALGTFSWELV